MKISQKALDIFWNTLTVVVFALMLIVIGRNLIHAIDIKRQIATLEYESEYYRNHITADSTLLEMLKFDDELERYAREHYRMKGAGEDLFIVEE